MAGILRGHLGQGRADGGYQVSGGSGFGAAEQSFDFAPHLFDRVQVGRVGRQKEHCGAVPGDQCEGGLVLDARLVLDVLRADDGRRLPVSVRGGGMRPGAAESPGAAAGQIGFRAGLVQKDPARRVESALAPAPAAPRPGDLRPVLFAGPECLFLYVSPMSAST